MRKLVVGHMYKEELNLYGDSGNVEVLVSRCLRRNIAVEVIVLGVGDISSQDRLSEINLLFMGGGPDSSQKRIYGDFLNEKRQFILDYARSEKAGLFVCGSYQLMGNYYKAYDGSRLEGLGVFDVYTENFGKDVPRCIGNVRAVLNGVVANDSFFQKISLLGNEIVGFENHGGRTYLGTGAVPFAHVSYGNGNNSEDRTEGAVFKNSIGTYFHGPVLAKNPHLADYLIAKALSVPELPFLDDKLATASYTASKKLR